MKTAALTALWLVSLVAISPANAQRSREADTLLYAEEGARVCVTADRLAGDPRALEHCWSKIQHLSTLCVAKYGREGRSTCNRYVNRVIGVSNN